MLLEQNPVDRAEMDMQCIKESFSLLDPGNGNAFHDLLDRDPIKEIAQDKLPCLAEISDTTDAKWIPTASRIW